MKHVSLNVSGKDIIAEIAALPEGVMVAIRPIAEAIGLAKPEKQYERLAGDPRFNPLHMESTGSDGKSRQMFCLPVEQIGPWLYTINSNKVKPEIRDVLLQFQQHLTRELNAVIMGQISIQKTAEMENRINAMELQLMNLSRQIETLTGLLSQAVERELKAQAELERFKKANGFRATAASYQMHARKAEIKH